MPFYNILQLQYYIYLQFRFIKKNSRKSYECVRYTYIFIIWPDYLFGTYPCIYYGRFLKFLFEKLIIMENYILAIFRQETSITVIMISRLNSNYR